MNNKEKILMIVGIMTLLLFVVGATFAYFVAQGGNGAQTNMSVTTHTTDSLVFEVGKPINITADQTTFAPGAGNRSDDTFARATLKANSSTNSATANYYVYLNIDTNEFKYTTDTKTAELILTVNYKDNSGNVTPVTSINGLNYVTVGEVSGFDITEEQNLITIANNYKITSTGTEVDEWDITLTLVNLDSDQTVNAGKTFNATLLIQKEELFVGHIIAQYTTQGENNLYHHNGTILDEEGNVLDAEDKSYRYAGGDYTITPVYHDTYKRVTNYSAADTESVIGFICDEKESYVGASCSSGKSYYYYLRYDTNETKIRYLTYEDAINKALLDGYIEKNTVKNYVCFGSDEENCPSDNLYRIIGVFNGKAKLIKADYAEINLLGEDGDMSESLPTSYYSGYRSQKEIRRAYWNKANGNLATTETGSKNLWSYSELNKTNLNKNYLDNIGNYWANLITETLWVTSGIQSPNYYFTIKDAFKNESGKNEANKEKFYEAKIGLMYVSDYLYGTVVDNWNNLVTTGLYVGPSAIFKSFNWLYLGLTEWTISRYSNTTVGVFYISNSGYLNYTNAKTMTSTSSAVRPTFYLKSSVTFAGGTGTETDPYRIK